MNSKSNETKFNQENLHKQQIKKDRGASFGHEHLDPCKKVIFKQIFTL